MSGEYLKKGDKLEIIPAGNYNKAHSYTAIDIEKIQKELKYNSASVYEFYA